MYRFQSLKEKCFLGIQYQCALFLLLLLCIAPSPAFPCLHYAAILETIDIILSKANRHNLAIFIWNSACCALVYFNFKHLK